MDQRYTDSDILELVREGYRDHGMTPIVDSYWRPGACCGLVAAALATGNLSNGPGLFHLRSISKAIRRSINWVYGFMAAWDDRDEHSSHPDHVAGHKCGRAARLEHILEHIGE